jgi:hypothetical protein
MRSAAVAAQPVAWAVHVAAPLTMSCRDRYWPSAHDLHGVPNLPAGHGSVQSETDVAPGAEARPGRHLVARHATELPTEYWPAAHISHEPLPASGWYRPAAQPVQAGEPGGAAVPLGQVVQAVEPGSGLNMPAAQATHAGEPG